MPNIMEVGGYHRKYYASEELSDLNKTLHIWGKNVLENRYLNGVKDLIMKSQDEIVKDKKVASCLYQRERDKLRVA